MPTVEHDFSELKAGLDRLLGVAPKADPLHVEWPKHPDGSNKTIGEMTRDEARAQTGAACRRLAAEFNRPGVKAGIAAILNREEPAPETEASIRASYAPYDEMPEFEEGFRCYQRGGSSSEYWAVGAAAQAFDRGFEAAMRVRRLQRGA
jgi:hypothetical protein